MRKKQRRELRKLRQTYTTEPLQIEGTITRHSTVPGRLGWLGRALTPLVGLVPSYEPTQSGRSFVKQVRVAVMVVGLIIAIWGGTMVTALVGCVIAMLAQVIPVAETTRVRWRQRLAALQRDQARATTTAVTLRYDGQHIHWREADGTERIIDTRAPHSVRLRRRGDSLALGIVPKKGGREAAFWLVSPPGDVDLGRLTSIAPDGVALPVSVERFDLVTLHDAICGDAEPIGPILRPDSIS